jgi:hypothetical protein
MIFLKGKNIKFIRTPTRTLDFSSKIALCRVAPKLEGLNIRPAVLEYHQSNYYTYFLSFFTNLIRD